MQNFYVILVAEKRLTENDPIRQEEINQILSSETINKSLPHLTPEHREELSNHYLGVTFWEDIVAELSLDSGVLIDRIDK